MTSGSRKGPWPAGSARQSPLGCVGEHPLVGMSVDQIGPGVTQVHAGAE